LVPVIVTVASLSISFEVIMPPLLAAESRLLVGIHATVARSIDIGIISVFDAISLPVIAKGQVIVDLTRPHLSDTPSVVEPLSGMSQVPLVVLARSEVLFEHRVLLLVDLVTLVLHPLLHDLLGLLLLVVELLHITPHVDLVNLEVSQGVVDASLVLVQLNLLERQLV